MGFFSRPRPDNHTDGSAPVDAEAKAQVLIERGNTREDQGHQAEALALYQEAAQLAPSLARAHLNIGNVLLQRGETEAALRAYDTAVGHEPTSAPAHFNLGNAQVRLKRHEEALRSYRNALAIAPDFVDAEVALGCVLDDVGQLPEAVASFRRALDMNPGYAAVHGNLAVTESRLGHFDRAADSYRELLRIEPRNLQALLGLGDALRQLGQAAEAASVFRAALALGPEHATTHVSLGNALMDLHEPASAAASYRKAIELDAGSTSAHSNLGNALRELGQLDDALASHRVALECDPRSAFACMNLGTVLMDLDRLDEAIAAYRRAVEIDANLAEAHFSLGNALSERGRTEDAIESFRSTVVARPDFAAAHHNLGVALRAVGRPAEAIEAFHQALELDAEVAETHTSLGNALADHGQITRAVASHLNAISLNRNLAEAHNNLGNALKDLGRLDEAIESYRKALSINPDYAAAQSNILFVLNYAGKTKPATCVEEARQFGRMLDRRNVMRFSSWRCPQRPERLRVGIVSGDLRTHPVGYFLQGVLSRVDASRLEFLGYPTSGACDDMTVVLKQGFKTWRSLSGLSDADAAKVIHDDEVHILLDLAGHTAGNRLGVFACKPAPVQATWLGYFGTTGVSQIDYIIGDRFVTPASEVHHFTEQVWPMPDSYLCFTPPTAAPEVAPLPAGSAGHVTFGCFNNLSKMSEDVVVLWARILRDVPGSRLMLKAHQLSDSGVREMTAHRFAREGVAPTRLLLDGFTSRADYLAAYNHVDLGLDPFPYPGGTTTVEGYWMGVPTVTRRGNRFLAHNGETIAQNAGLADWIAGSNDDYYERAVGWALDLDQLNRLRSGLRRKVQASPLCNAERFARNFETAM